MHVMKRVRREENVDTIEKTKDICYSCKKRVDTMCKIGIFFELGCNLVWKGFTFCSECANKVNKILFKDV